MSYRSLVGASQLLRLTVATIIYHASQQYAVSRYLTRSPLTVRPTVSRRSYEAYNPSQASYERFSLLLTKVYTSSPPLPSYLLCPSSKRPALPVSIKPYICKVEVMVLCSRHTSSGPPLRWSSSVLCIRRFTVKPKLRHLYRPPRIPSID